MQFDSNGNNLVSEQQQDSIVSKGFKQKEGDEEAKKAALDQEKKKLQQ